VARRGLSKETKTIFESTKTVGDAKRSYMVNDIGADLRGTAAVNEECCRESSKSVRMVEG
jgi:hypothetical protein